MTDDEAKGGSGPRSDGGDPTRTQQIPRVQGGQSGSNGAASAKRRPGPAAPATGSRPSGGPAKKAAPGQSSRPQAAPSGSTSSSSTPAGKKPAPAQKKPAGPATSAVKKAAAAPASGKPKARTSSSGTPDRAATREQARKLVDPAKGDKKPMTAADYARTTRGSAESTAVIPAVKDDRSGASRPSGSSDTAQVAAAAAGRGRQASLRLTRVEPWSVTRLAFVVSVALMIVAVVAVTIFWIVLDLTGIWDQLNGSITNVLSDDEGSFDLTDYLGLGRLVGLTLVLSAINVVLMTALATIAAHLYNLAAQLLGGVHVTFSDD